METEYIIAEATVPIKKKLRWNSLLKQILQNFYLKDSESETEKEEEDSYVKKTFQVV